MAVKKIRKKKLKKVKKGSKDQERYEAIKEAKRFMSDKIPTWEKKQLQDLIGIDILARRRDERESKLYKKEMNKKIEKIREKGEKKLRERPVEERKEFEEAFKKVYRHPEVFADLEDFIKEKYFTEKSSKERT